MKYRRINLKDWERKGEGNTAESYFHKSDKTLMLKLFTSQTTSSRYVQREFDYTEHVLKLGIKIPKAHEIVLADGRLGIIYERIPNKVSLSRLIADNPSNIQRCAEIFANELKKLHKTKCNTNFFPSIKDTVIHCVSSNKLFNDVQKKMLYRYVRELGDNTTCLHGDPHTGNLVMSKVEPWWIDIGEFSYGNPWYDIGGVYFFYKLYFGRMLSKKILHMNGKELTSFWNSFVQYYSKDNDIEKDVKIFEEKAKKSCLLFFLYTMDTEHYEGAKKLLAEMAVKQLLNRWFKHDKKNMKKTLKN